MNEIKTWEESLIKDKVKSIRSELFTLRMQKGVSRIDKPHQIKDRKRDIARLLTALRSKREK
ncbi:MAG: 50S ribosomal protein L29 [Bacteriovoracaceae bacterium]|nr:50S ribosomal protein L29 [Bacteriovoracaceae bacterium]